MSDNITEDTFLGSPTFRMGKYDSHRLIILGLLPPNPYNM